MIRRGVIGLTLIALFVFLPHGRSQPKAVPDKAKPAVPDKDDHLFTKVFPVSPGELGPNGMNPYFSLERGYTLVYKVGKDELTIAVTAETKKVDGVETRVIEERESKDGKLYEVSRNFFAISKKTNSVYYFGEEVDFYENGKVSGHEGAWLSGEKGAKFGLAMPGTILLGSRFYNEVAPGVAVDRMEIVSISETVEVPAGTFKNCLKFEETNPLEPGVKEYKYYAPGIGLIKDDKMELVKYGKLDLPKK